MLNLKPWVVVKSTWDFDDSEVDVSGVVCLWTFGGRPESLALV